MTSPLTDGVMPRAPQSVPGSASGIDPAQLPLNEQDRQTATELRSVDPQLADLFLAGHRLLAQPTDLSEPYVLAHIGRELSRGVVRLLADERAVDIPVADEEEALADDEANRATIGRVLGQTPQHPSVTTWFRLNRLFSTSCHFRNRGPDGSRVRAAFTQLSGMLYGRLAPFFTTQAELGILARIQVPTARDIEHALSLLLRRTQRDFFYGVLGHPGWLAPLYAAGAFALPPETATDERGVTYFVRWPEGRYLARVAGLDPEGVSAIIRDIPRTVTNPLVLAPLFEAAVAMPAAQAVALVKVLCKALHRCAEPAALAHAAVDLTAKLAAVGAPQAFVLADSLMWPASEAVVAPTREIDIGGTMVRVPMHGGSDHALEWLFARLPSYELGRLRDVFMATLGALDPERAATILTKRLDRACQLVEQGADTPFHPHRSTWWCDDLRRADLSVDDPRAHLATALNAVAELAAERDAITAQVIYGILGSRSRDVFPRIRLNMLARAGAVLQEQLDAVIGSEELIVPAYGLREAAALLRAQFAQASPGARRLFQYAVERGPAADVLERLVHQEQIQVPTTNDASDLPEDEGSGRASDPEDDAPVEPPADPLLDDEVISGLVGRWQARIIRRFHDRIPVELAPLAQRIGVEAHVPSPNERALDEGRMVEEPEEWRSEVARVPEGFTELSEPALLAFLDDWIGARFDREDGSAGAAMHSAADLRSALWSYAALHPDRALSVAGVMLERGNAESYAAALLEGITRASTVLVTRPWNEIVVLVKRILEGADGIAALRSAQARLEADSDRDPNTDRGVAQDQAVAPVRDLVLASLRLVTQGCQLEELPDTAASAAWTLARLSAQSVLISSEPLESRAPTSVHEVLAYAQETTAGASTEFVCVLANWDYRRLARNQPDDDPATVTATIEPRLAPLLEELLGARGGALIATEAQLGRYFPSLSSVLAPTWCSEHETVLFEGGVRAPVLRPAWAVFLQNGMYPRVFTRLRPWYHAAAQGLEAGPRDERDVLMEQALARQVIFAYLAGLCELDDSDQLFQLTYTNVRTTARMTAYEAVGRFALRPDRGAAPDFGPRLGRFWQWRLDRLATDADSPQVVAEIERLMTFFAAKTIPARMAIELAVGTLERLGDGEHRILNVAWERAGEIARELPDESFPMTEALIDQALRSEFRYIPANQVSPALRPPLASSNSDIRRRAVQLVHRLGEAGLYDFGELLSAPSDADATSPAAQSGGAGPTG
jgi:hypothetical protein